MTVNVSAGDLKGIRSAVVGADRAPDTSLSRITDDSICVLHSFVIRRHADNGYIVVRIGCRTLTSVATSRIGSVATRLLSNGYSIREVKDRLAATTNLHSNNATMTCLLQALLDARMIRSIDGIKVGEEKGLFWNSVVMRLRFAARAFSESAWRATYAVLPTNIAHGAATRSKLLFRPSHSRSVAETALCNIRRYLGDALDDERCRGLAKEFAKERAKSKVDREILARPNHRVLLWLFRHSVIHGLDNYREAKEQGKGVALCVLHFSSAYLLLPILWLHGLSFVGAGAAPRHDLARVIDFREQFGDVSGQCGEVSWSTKVSLSGALSIVRALRRNETALIFGDGLIARENRNFACDLGHDLMGFDPSLIPIDFFGHQLYANASAAWFSSQFDGPVLPVRLQRQGGRFHVYIERPLSRRGDMVRELYHRLERGICLDPAGWSYWDRVSDMSPVTHA